MTDAIGAYLSTSAESSSSNPCCFHMCSTSEENTPPSINISDKIRKHQKAIDQLQTKLTQVQSVSSSSDEDDNMKLSRQLVQMAKAMEGLSYTDCRRFEVWKLGHCHFLKTHPKYLVEHFTIQIPITTTAVTVMVLGNNTQSSCCVRFIR